MFLSLCGEPPIRSLNGTSVSLLLLTTHCLFRLFVSRLTLNPCTDQRRFLLACDRARPRNLGVFLCRCTHTAVRYLELLLPRYELNVQRRHACISPCETSCFDSRQLPNCTRIASFPLPTACTSFPPCRASFCPVPLPEPLSTQPLANIPSSPPINEQTSDLNTPPSKPIPNPTSLEMTGFST